METFDKKTNVNSENSIKKRKKRIENDIPKLSEIKNLPDFVTLHFKTKTISTVLSLKTLYILDLYLQFSEQLAPTFSKEIHYGSIIDGLTNKLKGNQEFKNYCINNFPEVVEHLF